MQVVQIAVGKLIPNPWNVNRMSAGMQKKLTAYIRREGLVEPLVSSVKCFFPSTTYIIPFSFR